MADIDPQELTDRYVAVWNEPDAELRRKAIRELWAEDGLHVLKAPEDIARAAAGVGFISTTLEARGHEALEYRVSCAHEEFVASGSFLFRSRGNADRIRDIVKFTWEMVPPGGGEAVAVGLEIFILDRDGRVTADYQFIER